MGDGPTQAGEVSVQVQGEVGSLWGFALLSGAHLGWGEGDGLKKGPLPEAVPGLSFTQHAWLACSWAAGKPSDHSHFCPSWWPETVSSLS